MNQTAVAQIAKDGFPAPKNCQFLNLKQESEIASTQDSNNSAKPLQSRRHAPDSAASVISQQIAQGDRKTKMMLHLITTFEENCIVSQIVCSQKLKSLRNYSRRYLGRILNNYEAIKS